VSRSTAENQNVIGPFSYALRLRTLCGSQTRAPCLSINAWRCPKEKRQPAFRPVAVFIRRHRAGLVGGHRPEI